MLVVNMGTKSAAVTDLSILLIHFVLFLSRRAHCNHGAGDHPLYVNVDMMSGAIHTSWIDSLQAAFAGVQVNNQDDTTLFFGLGCFCTVYCVNLLMTFRKVVGRFTFHTMQKP
jgi:hypothetical protein